MSDKSNLIQVDCRDCKVCCAFHFLIDEWLTENEVREEFGFDRDLAEIFFEKKDLYYHVGTHCLHHKGSRCMIHGQDIFPFSCAFYPFFIVRDKKEVTKLAVDKSCPRWKELVKHEDKQALMARIKRIIDFYQAKDQLQIYPLANLKRSGYKMKVLFEIKI